MADFNSNEPFKIDDDELADELEAGGLFDKLRQVELPPKTEEELQAQSDQLDQWSNDLERRDAAWISALARWGIEKDAHSPSDPTSEHPLARSYWGEEHPDEWTREQARAAHAKWKRQKNRRDVDRDRKQAAGFKAQGLTVDEGAELARDRDEKFERLIAEARSKKRTTDLYVSCASLVVQAWREKGATLQGVRMDEQGLVSPNSKAVRWFKSITDGKEPRRVRETARRLAKKTRGWEKDIAAFKAFQ